MGISTSAILSASLPHVLSTFPPYFSSESPFVIMYSIGVVRMCVGLVSIKKVYSISRNSFIAAYE